MRGVGGQGGGGKLYTLKGVGRRIQVRGVMGAREGGGSITESREWDQGGIIGKGHDDGKGGRGIVNCF